MELGVEVRGEREASKVCLIDREDQLSVGGCELCWLEREVIVKIAGI